jgi:hypothetical protein
MKNGSAKDNYTRRSDTSGSAAGKNNLSNTRPVAVPYRKKSKYSMEPATKLASKTRRVLV